MQWKSATITENFPELLRCICPNYRSDKNEHSTQITISGNVHSKAGCPTRPPSCQKTLHTGRLVLRCLNCDCVCQVHLCLSLCQNRLLPIYSPFAAQRFNNLSPMSVMCPLPSGTMTSPQPSIMLSIRAYNWYLSRVTITILIRDFCLSVRHVTVFCLNKSTQHQTRLSFYYMKGTYSIFGIPSAFQNSEANTSTGVLK